MSQSFMSSVGTNCGPATADVSPFYCSADDTAYLDLRFFAALEQHLGVSGDFSLAYVVAHEMGHHIQNLMGIRRRVARADQQDPALATGIQCASSCRLTAWPGYGLTPHMNAICSSPATLTKPSRRPPMTSLSARTFDW